MNKLSKSVFVVVILTPLYSHSCDRDSYEEEVSSTGSINNSVAALCSSGYFPIKPKASNNAGLKSIQAKPYTGPCLDDANLVCSGYKAMGSRKEDKSDYTITIKMTCRESKKSK